MAYPDDLLDLAREIANPHAASPNQASLRRAVSTAYYALFHLLISEATANWARPELRAALARVFDHGPMRQAAENKVSELKRYCKKSPPEGPERTIADHLLNVAEIFTQAQYHRFEADYNTAREWGITGVLEQIDSIADAFKSWRIIRDDPAAQAFLVSMLGKERRQAERSKPEKRPTLSDSSAL